MGGKVIIFSAPSGSGKSTIVSHLLKHNPKLEFSISATSRAPRGSEKDGVEYYFMSHKEFSKRADDGDFIEWEEVYNGTCYGTLKSEIDRIWAKENIIIFDIDVKGGINIKSIFGDNALALFIMPPSVDELRKRLIGRGTDSVETIEKRVGKAESEIAFADKFDKIIVNDNLKDAIAETEKIIAEFISK